MTDLVRLLKNLVVLLIIGGVGYVIYLFFFKASEKEGLKIDETPIHVESIRSIAEISTVNYKDEVVMDSVIRHKGNSTWSWFDSRQMYDKYLNSNIKRRLTLIVRGEVRFGVDLSESNFATRQTEDSIFIQLPKPKVLDVVVSPSKTEVFQEQGKWSDRERKTLEVKAKAKLVENAMDLDLNSKTEKNMRRLMKQMIITDKKVIISFDK
ncbi:MAG: DUF4230 domain-containing protein [Crocinitomicaceae bacterium]|nr:DUF4230 domain-containing protein [Crocinitomicaceae bacterium]